MKVRAADAAAGDIDEHLSDRRCGALDVDYAHVPAGGDNGRPHWSVAAAGISHDESASERIRLLLVRMDLRDRTARFGEIHRLLCLFPAELQAAHLPSLLHLPWSDGPVDRVIDDGVRVTPAFS
jgi:hypothetical protein